MDESVLRHLKQAADRGRLVPFVGAGFSSAVAGMPSWNGLLDSFENFVGRQDLRVPVSADDVQRALDRAKGGGRLIDAFEEVQRLLGGRDAVDYAVFLEDAFGEPTLISADLLDGLAALESPLIVTTNYDAILENWLLGEGGGAWSTWNDTERAVGQLRRGSGVIHLHGRYDHPESVVLSASDYQEISNTDSALDHLSSAIFYSGTLLFITTSLDGVTDPHLGQILDEFGKIASADPLRSPPHVILMRGEPKATERVTFRKLGIEAISYGEKHSDLPVFLRQLARDRETVLATDPLRDLAAHFRSARNKTALITLARDFIEKQVFAGRQVRIGFVEKDAENPYLLRPDHIFPHRSSANAFIYPATFAGWSLVTGRIVSFPADRSTLTNFDWLEKLGKGDRVRSALKDLATAPISPTFRKYLDIDRVLKLLDAGSLTVGDFFQDWDSDQPKPTYRQFICVPLPMIDKGSSEKAPDEIGVFNIDTAEPLALLTPAVESKLNLVIEMLHSAWINLMDK